MNVSGHFVYISALVYAGFKVINNARKSKLVAVLNLKLEEFVSNKNWNLEESLSDSARELLQKS